MAESKPKQLKKLSFLARAIQITLIIGIVFDVLFGITNVMNLLIGPAPGDAETWDMIHVAAALLTGGVAIISLVVFLVNAVLIMQWMYRAYLNLEFINTPGLTTKASWAILFWFVPIANLFKPYQVMKEIWQASDPQSDGQGFSASLKPPRIFGLWWAFWIVNGVIGQITFRLEMAKETTMSDAISVIGQAASVIGALLLIQVIKQTTARQEAKIPELKSL